MMYEDVQYGLWQENDNFVPQLKHSNVLLEKNKSNIVQFDLYSKVENEESQHCLDDVMMLEDIQKFNRTTNFNAVQDDQTLPAFTELQPVKSHYFLTSSSPPSSSVHGSSHTLDNPDEFIPNFLETSNDTFQDLTPLLSQESTSHTVSTSFSDSYSVCTTFSENSNSTSAGSYKNETFSTTESYIQRHFNTASPELFSTGSKIPKCASNIVIKHEKHHNIRKKNNMASQRSRMTRKEKEREMEKKAIMLEQENESLRIKAKKMEEIAEEMKKLLMQSLFKR